MPQFSWIQDGQFEDAVEEFKKRIIDCKNKASKRIEINVLDPFSFAGLAHVFKPDTVEELINYGETASAISCVGNALGNFHQSVLGSANGWQLHNRGYDLESEEMKILAEIKNKHNTMNSANRKKVIENLEIAISQKPRGWTGYLVHIIPKFPKRYCRKVANNDVFETDGATFYELVSGKPNALHEVLDALCDELELNGEIAEWIRKISSLPSRMNLQE